MDSLGYVLSHSYGSLTRFTSLLSITLRKQQSVQREMDRQRQTEVAVPVWHVDVDDAGLQQIPVQVCAGNKQPALVVGQAVPHQENTVALGSLPCCLPHLQLPVPHGSQHEGRRVQLQRTGPLGEGERVRGDILGDKQQGQSLSVPLLG